MGFRKTEKKIVESLQGTIIFIATVMILWTCTKICFTILNSARDSQILLQPRNSFNLPNKKVWFNKEFSESQRNVKYRKLKTSGYSGMFYANTS